MANTNVLLKRFSRRDWATNINVVDSIMGSGKTSWAIQYMNEANNDTNFLYITPFLSETKRIQESVQNRNFATPEAKGKSKLDNLKQLVLNERDIASTHALFQNVDEELIELLKAGNYVLILDEVMNVVEQYGLYEDDIPLLLVANMIKVDEETCLIQWNEEGDFQDTKYNNIKSLAKTENLYYFENKVLFWTFPISAFKAFREVYVMTYLFQCQQQKYYYDMFSFDYSYKGVRRLPDNSYALIDHEDKEPYDKSLIKSLINIYDGKLNYIGDENNAFSVSWFKKKTNKHLVEKLKRNIYTYFRRHADTPAKVNMWTCFKDNLKELAGAGYRGTKKNECFVSHNARATNQFKHKETLVYAINKFMQPYEMKFFLKKGVEVNQDMYALSELIQWIWRSRIRDGKPINLYIPSKRMRTLLKEWLESEL